MPMLNIDETGYPNFNIDQVFSGFDLNIYDYLSDDSENNFEKIELLILQSNKSFNLFEILFTMANLEMKEEAEIDNDLYYVVQDFKYVIQLEDGSYTFTDNLSNEDNIQNKITDSYDHDEATSYYDIENYTNNINYDVDDTNNDTENIDNSNHNKNNSFFTAFPEFKTKNATLIVELEG
ncbi:hypothetical protein PIROE2DRAFT_63030 [Piromyces sp. E2]|nr:hypothetical protein PIROE2DRAFT_63030 [Piromyces sp. E2]|eukprot:OUM60625.1 hypothetical protein PIROE2DRAFT_63030 [Piromyces sp. E2]